MNPEQLPDRLGFDQHEPFDQKIDALPRNVDALVANIDLLLSLEEDASEIELQAEGSLIDALAEARTKLAMNCERAIHRLRKHLLFALGERGFDPKHRNRPI